MNTLFGIFIWIVFAVWLLEMGCALYVIIKAKKEGGGVSRRAMGPVEYGVLGVYDVEGDDVYGIYIKIYGNPVLVDLREDSLLEKRKEQALLLFENQDLLEKNFFDFTRRHEKYRGKTVSSIGLYSPKVTQGEVFWLPDGSVESTLLEGFNFIDNE